MTLNFECKNVSIYQERSAGTSFNERVSLVEERKNKNIFARFFFLQFEGEHILLALFNFLAQTRRESAEGRRASEGRGKHAPITLTKNSISNSFTLLIPSI